MEKNVTYENLTIRKGDDGYVATLACPNCKRTITLNSAKGYFSRTFQEYGLSVETDGTYPEGYGIKSVIRCEHCGKRVELTKKQARLFDLPLYKFKKWYAEMEEEQKPKGTPDFSVSPDMVHPP